MEVNMKKICFFKKIIKSKQGMTLIEILVVLAIIGTILGLVGANVFSRLDVANVKSANNQIIGFESALDLYYLDNGMYPTTEQGLEALLNEPTSGPKPYSYAPDGYLKGKKIPLDPWNNAYAYESDGSNYKITSYGKDKKEGGSGYAKDIIIENK